MNDLMKRFSEELPFNTVNIQLSTKVVLPVTRISANTSQLLPSIDHKIQYQIAKIKTKQKIKNIQQLGFAGGHPPNY